MTLAAPVKNSGAPHSSRVDVRNRVAADAVVAAAETGERERVGRGALKTKNTRTSVAKNSAISRLARAVHASSRRRAPGRGFAAVSAASASGQGAGGVSLARYSRGRGHDAGSVQVFPAL